MNRHRQSQANPAEARGREQASNTAVKFAIRLIAHIQFLSLFRQFVKGLASFSHALLLVGNLIPEIHPAMTDHFLKAEFPCFQ
jgi:hypothetical protein